MGSVQKVSCLSTTTTSTATSGGGGGGYNGNSCTSMVVPDQFPVGLRVLVVDDDTTCLRILEQMLRKCSYHVTTCCQAAVALNLLRERKGCFDVVISDVHMPDMDGFKLLELVGLEMDLPVIMMSADGRTSAVMRGIKHGACDYLIKPVRMEELKNIWQHVVRKKWNGSRDLEQSSSIEETDRYKRGGDDIEYASSANEGTDGNWKVHKKRKDTKEEEEEGDLDNDDPSTSKKPRVVWSVELHQQFVGAVNQLGIDKAVPKRILELMNVPGLTRENVASHLQKFRLYLKRLSGVAQQQNGISNVYYGPGESTGKLHPLSGVDIQTLAASGQIPPQTLAALHAEVFGRPASSIVLPVVDKSVLLQASLHGNKCVPVEQGVTFGQPIAKCSPQLSKHSSQSSVVEDIPSGYNAWLPNNIGSIGSMGNQGGLNTNKNNTLRQVLPQQQLHQSVLPESSHTINVQPSCVVVPSQSQNNFHGGNMPVPFNQSSTFSSSGMVDYNFHSSQPHSASVGLGQLPDVDPKNTGVLDGYSLPGSISSSVSSTSDRVDSVSSWQVQNSSMNPSVATKLQGQHMWGVQGSYTSKRGDFLNQVGTQNIGFAGKGTVLPSRFAVDEFELPMGDLSHGKTHTNNEGGVKQELILDFIDNTKSWHASDATIFS